MRAEQQQQQPRTDHHMYVKRGALGQANSPIYAQIARKRNINSNNNNSSVAERIAQFEYQAKEIVRDSSSPSSDQVKV